jgi:hypothetical protein
VKDHSHPLVNLALKSPQTDEGMLFSSLAEVTRTAAPSGAPKLIRRPRGFQQRDLIARQDGGPAAARSEFPWCDSLPAYDACPATSPGKKRRR